MLSDEKTPQRMVELWNSEITPVSYGTSVDVYVSHVFEQYKIYVESAEQVSTRRATMNSLFLTVQALLLTVIGLLFDTEQIVGTNWILVFPLTGAILLCLVWYTLIRSYRRLNQCKYRIIGEFESHLPASPFTKAEWYGCLQMNSRSGRVKRLTEVEQYVPIAFMIMYVLAFSAVFLT